MSRKSSSAAYAIAIVAVAQLFGTSLWFSANAAADDLMRAWGATTADIGLLTGAVQIGFICGTAVLALTGLADRFRASRIFIVSAILGAVFNACFALFAQGFVSGAAFRLLVGICLAGIYPLGMKLIVSWAPERASSSLALLVGMLTLGTALPYSIRLAGSGWAWQHLILSSSALALVAAALIFFLGDGPNLTARRSKTAVKTPTIFQVVRLPEFRAVSMGYFGHMWELYAFWTLVPVFVDGLDFGGHGWLGGPAGISFLIIGSGTVGCLFGGVLSRKFGSARVAASSLAISGACCLLFPLKSSDWSSVTVLILLVIWGASVVADSPQFSSMAARNCPPQFVGSALALQNCIGFAITVISIGLVTRLVGPWGAAVSWLLLPGPVFGLLALRPLLRR